MAKKKEEIKNEMVTEEPTVTTETNENVEEVKNTTEEVKAEKKEKTEKAKEKIIANITFIDRYTNAVYEEGTEFIIANVEKTEKVTDKKYKISKERAEQIKAKGYAN